MPSVLPAFDFADALDEFDASVAPAFESCDLLGLPMVGAPFFNRRKGQIHGPGMRVFVEPTEALRSKCSDRNALGPRSVDALARPMSLDRGLVVLQPILADQNGICAEKSREPPLKA